MRATGSGQLFVWRYNQRHFRCVGKTWSAKLREEFPYSRWPKSRRYKQTFQYLSFARMRDGSAGVSFRIHPCWHLKGQILVKSSFLSCINLLVFLFFSVKLSLSHPSKRHWWNSSAYCQRTTKSVKNLNTFMGNRASGMNGKQPWWVFCLCPLRY